MTNPQQFGPDMQNRIAIGRVLFMVFMAVLFSSLLAPAAMLYFLCVLSFSVAVVSIMLAAYRGEQLWGPVLNRWDEALAYLALALLSNALRSATGSGEAPAF